MTAEGSAESAVRSRIRGEPAEIIVRQREVDDQVIVGDLVRPAAQRRQLGIGEEADRHEARYLSATINDGQDRAPASARKRIRLRDSDVIAW
jgi:hypothetical protein